MPNKPPPPDDADELPWRPRPQSPAESFTSFRQLREQIREERERASGEQPVVALPPLPSEPLITPPPISVLTPLIVAQDATQVRAAIPTHDTLAEALVRAPSGEQAHKMSSPKQRNARSATFRFGQDDGPTLQQRVSAVITGIVGILIVVVVIARPLLNAHASQPPHQPPSMGVAVLPTSTPGPVYAPMLLDVDHPPPILWAESAFVMDETNGTVLYAKNPDEQLPMASTTKLMTAVVALSHGKPDQLITITADAANTFCTCVGLKVGEQYTLTELLYGMLMISGNDAAEAIAVGEAGSVTTFVRWMNETAVALGLTHTHYINPHGLDDDGHYSSARDLAVLGRYALSIPLLQQLDNTRTYTMPATATHPKHELANLHESLWWYPGADGGKPGWTGGARFVDILSAVRDGHHLIAVVMHSANDWVTDIRDLLNWGFDDFTWVSPREIDKQHWIPFDDSYSYFSWDVPSRIVLVDTREYFPYTGYIVADAFLTFFNTQGGLTTFGFPRGMPVPAANGTLRQHFDHADIICNVATSVCQKA